MKILGVIGVLLAAVMSVTACANQRDDWRTYEGVFEGYKLLPEQKKWVKKLDRWVFKESDGIFVSPFADYDETRFAERFQGVMYSGFLNRRVKWISSNEGALQDVFLRFMLKHGRAIEDSNILVVGLSGIDDLNDLQFRNSLGEFDFSQLLEGEKVDAIKMETKKCFLFRKSQQSLVRKTLIVVVSGLPESKDRKSISEQISCINRGHYFHFGFSNVDMIADTTFAAYSDVSGDISMDSPKNIQILPPLVRGGLVGKSRSDFLRGFLELQEGQMTSHHKTVGGE